MKIAFVKKKEECEVGDWGGKILFRQTKLKEFIDYRPALQKI